MKNWHIITIMYKDNAGVLQNKSEPNIINLEAANKKKKKAHYIVMSYPSQQLLKQQTTEQNK